MAVPINNDGINAELLTVDNHISYGVPCLICRESIPVEKYDFSPKVCDNCRAAVLRLRQYIAEKEEF